MEILITSTENISLSKQKISLWTSQIKVIRHQLDELELMIEKLMHYVDPNKSIAILKQEFDKCIDNS